MFLNTHFPSLTSSLIFQDRRRYEWLCLLVVKDASRGSADTCFWGLRVRRIDDLTYVRMLDFERMRMSEIEKLIF